MIIHIYAKVSIGMKMTIRNQDEQILEIVIDDEYCQFQAEIEQLKQQQKSCFSLTDVILVGLSISLF